MANITSLKIGKNTLKINGQLLKHYEDPNAHQWCRIYSDGWCEQGGSFQCVKGWSTVTFTIPFLDTNYVVYGSVQEETSDSDVALLGTANFTNTGVSVCSTWNSRYYAMNIRWKAEGYIDLNSDIVRRILNG